MKVICLFLFGILLAEFNYVHGQTYCFTAPQGYGSGITGGGNASPTTVSSQAELQSALTASGNGVILVSGSISCSYMSLFITNKTLIGLPGARLRNLNQTKDGSGIINIKGGSNNVIVRNLIFEGPGAYDTDGRDLMTIENSTKIWIDHCEFQDGMDGNLDQKGTTDNTTISWCKFTYLKAPKPDGSGGTDDHRFSNLVGSSDSDKPSDGKYSITWQYCWWAPGCVERMTRARNAQLNMINCYWNSQQTKVALGLGYSDCYVENSVFANTGDKYRNYGGTVRLTSVGCTAPPANVGTCPAPTYTREVIPVGSVVSAVTGPCGAGATLNVTSAGVVSANAACSSTPTLALTSGTASQSVSAGAAIASTVFTWGGNANDVNISGLPAGLTSTKNTTAKTITISGTPTASGTYTVTTVQSAGTAVSLSGTITVVPLVAPTLVLTSGSASQTVYTGTAITPIVYTWGGGATDVTISGLPTGVTAAKNAGAKTVTLSGTPSTAGIYDFSVVSLGGSSPVVTLTGKITVTTPVILATPGNVTATSTSTTATIDWNPVPNATGYVVNFCSSTGGGIADSWTFPSTTLNAANADANLQVDGTNARFNYIPASTNTALVFENGNPIADAQGLLFTQAGTSKVRLGYDASHPYLYLNGSNIAVGIPCTSGDKITVVGPAGNAAAVDRGYSVTGGTLNTAELINVNSTGIMNVAGATGTWVYTATSSAVTITTVTGGMNISSITVSNGSGTTCTEYPVSGGSNTIYTVTGLTPSTTYTYQVKATNNSPAETSPYTGSANVTTTGVNASPIVSIMAPVNNPTVCLGTAIALTASASDPDGSISKVEFYNGSTLLGTVTTTPYTFNWTNAGTGIHSITAKATDNQSAVTTSAAESLTVNAIPSTPTVTTPVTYCQNATATALTATGSNLLWYTASTGGTGSTAPIPSTTTAGTTNHYVSQTVSGCESARAQIAVTVNAILSTPTVTTPVTYCQNATATALTATGSNLLWYTASTGGTGSSTAPIPSTTTAGTTNHYVSQTVSGCESARAQIAVTVNATPSAPTVTTPVTYCQNATATALTATGTNLLWYPASTGGTGSSTAPTPSTATAGTTNHYVSQTVSGCESARAQIAVTVNATPSAPTVTTPVTYCQNTTSTALTATGANLLWYTASTGGTGSSTAPTPSTATAGTTNHYVSQTVSGCESARAQIAVTVNATPSAPTVTTPVTYCQNATATALTATGTNLLWYTASTSGTGSSTAPTPTTATAGTTNHYVSQTVSGCESARAQIAVTVNATPSAPTVTTPVTYCQNATATALTATGTNLLWYTASTGGTGASTAPTPTTATAGTTNHYVSQTVSGCESTRATIAVLVNSNPTAIITANGPTTFIQGGSVQLSANTGTDLTYRWLNGPAGVGTNSTYTATTGGNYTVEVYNASGCKATSVVTVVTVNGNTAPEVSITSPANNANFMAPSSITITANASDADGTITMVDFYNGTTFLGTDNSAPYSFVLNNVMADTYSITAVATDNLGATTSSGVITIIVYANQRPTVTITSPAHGETFTATANLTITATASDADGTVAQVDFYNGANLIGSDNSTPYSVDFNGLAAGTYSITAVATDNLGDIGTSSIVSITVNANQSSVINITSPVSNSTVSGPVTITVNATDPDGSITLVEYLDGTSVIGSSTTQPYTFEWNGATDGDHTITVRVTDSNGGVTTSSPVTFTVGMGTGIFGSSYETFTQAYPNPFTNEISLNLNSSVTEKIHLKIIDLRGEVVYESNAYSTNETIRLGENLPEGIFIIQAVCNGKVVVTRIEKLK